jgi:hypothetical protein
MQTNFITSRSTSLSKEQRNREAVLLSFCDPLPPGSSSLWRLSIREWQKLLFWLDTSGLALYFLERVVELQLADALPPIILSRLMQNLRDNTERIAALCVESNAIHREFQNAGLSYATLKGFSLWPISVPKLELRSQLDLDFLIAEESAAAARTILEGRGYRLHGVSGRSWEFKTVQTFHPSIKNLYKDVSSRCVELHIERRSGERSSLLQCVIAVDFDGVPVPVLSPIDLFLGQGMHLFKHLCNEFSRASHIVEFRRHVLARRGDNAFWTELRAVADPMMSIGLGLVTLLITNLMGDFAPKAFTSWTSDTVPDFVRLWVKLHGRHVVLASFPGSKRYLLLQRELQEAGIRTKRSVTGSLIPRTFPPPVAPADANESLSVRFSRYRTQISFILFRLRFHVVEGARYLRESSRWKRERSRVTRDACSR